ncbi:MAG: hypothetical protein HY897_04545 [Deltaproteobacteria bacterium]|nr:hypothetical protein [Deltaproteobacteria bacterium]
MNKAWSDIEEALARSEPFYATWREAIEATRQRAVRKVGKHKKKSR